MDNIIKIISKPDNVAILIMMILVAFFAWLAFREAIRTDREKRKTNDKGQTNEKKVKTDEDKIHVWPYLVRKEFLIAILLLVFLLVWSIFLDAPLEEESNPTLTPIPAKAPW